MMQPNHEEKFSAEDIRRLAISPQGKQLLAFLQQTEGQRLHAATKQAAAGDMEGLKQTLAPLLDSPQIRALLRQLGG